MLALSFLYLTTVKRDVPSAKSFRLDFNSFGKSLMKTRKIGGPRIDPWGTPATTGLLDEVYPFNTTCWNLSDK